MKQTNVKSDRVALLLEEVMHRTGESKVTAVQNALELRLKQLDAAQYSDELLGWLESSVWSRLPAEERGRAMSKAEEESILGY